MLFKPLDLTTALRPLLFPDESLIFVQDVVGLYEGYNLCFSERWVIALGAIRLNNDEMLTLWPSH